MSAMFQLLEFVRWGIGNKKGPKTRAWSDRCTLSQDARQVNPIPLPEVGPRIRTLKLEYVMMFTITWSHSASVPSHDQVTSRNTLASSEGHRGRSWPITADMRLRTFVPKLLFVRRIARPGVVYAIPSQSRRRG